MDVNALCRHYFEPTLMHLEHGWEKEDKKEGCFLYSG